MKPWVGSFMQVYEDLNDALGRLNEGYSIVQVMPSVIWASVATPLLGGTAAALRGTGTLLLRGLEKCIEGCGDVAVRSSGSLPWWSMGALMWSNEGHCSGKYSNMGRILLLTQGKPNTASPSVTCTQSAGGSGALAHCNLGG